MDHVYIGEYTLPAYDQVKYPNGHQVKIYKTTIWTEKINIPDYLLQIPTDKLIYAAQILNVPSSRLWYYARDGQTKIPYIANDPQTIHEDILRWKPLYNIACQVQSINLEENIYAVLHGCDPNPVLDKQKISKHLPPMYIDASKYPIASTALNNGPYLSVDQQKHALEEFGVYHLNTRSLSIFEFTRFYSIPKYINIRYMYIYALYTYINYETHAAYIILENYLNAHPDREQTIQTLLEYMAGNPQQAMDVIQSRNIKRINLHNLTKYVDMFYLPKPPPLSIELLQTIPDNQMVNFLMAYTDNQLEDFFGPNKFIIRSDMLVIIAEHILQSGWFIGTSYIPCGNQISIMTQEPINNQPFLVYGRFKPPQFTCYSIQDLEYTFNHYADQHIYPNPYNTNQRFTKPDLLHIRNILPNGPLKTMLGNIQILNQPAYLLQQYLDARPEIHQQVKNYFLQFFYLGMYLRRWKGPGHEYPLTQTLTEGDTFLCEQGFQTARLSTEAGIQLNDILQTLPIELQNLISELYVMIKYNDTYQRDTITIGEMIQQIGDAEYCIRIASSRVAYTGAVYLDKYFHEQPPGFSIHTSEIAWH